MPIQGLKEYHEDRKKEVDNTKDLQKVSALFL